MEGGREGSGGGEGGTVFIYKIKKKIKKKKDLFPYCCYCLKISRLKYFLDLSFKNKILKLLFMKRIVANSQRTSNFNLKFS